jgi:nucleoid DNA-binding protein
VVNEFFKTISNILIDLNRIELRHFGVFEIRRYLERRNNKNNNEISNNERFVPFFRGSKLSFHV